MPIQADLKEANVIHFDRTSNVDVDFNEGVTEARVEFKVQKSNGIPDRLTTGLTSGGLRTNLANGSFPDPTSIDFGFQEKNVLL